MAVRERGNIQPTTFRTDQARDILSMHQKRHPPALVKLPVLVYAACGGMGTSYTNLLTEVASHGYFVIVAGPPAPKMPKTPAWNPKSSMPKLPAFNMSSIPKMTASPKTSAPKFTMPPSTDVIQMRNAVDWVIAGKAAKYGNIDSAHIATGGLSCGGLQVEQYLNTMMTNMLIFILGHVNVLP